MEECGSSGDFYRSYGCILYFYLNGITAYFGDVRGVGELGL